jgi:hypothetical protein
MKEAKKPLRTKPRNGRKTSLKNLNTLQLQPQKQQLPLPPRMMLLMMTSLIIIISRMLLSNLMISLKINQLAKEIENIVIMTMILVILIPTIPTLTKL